MNRPMPELVALGVYDAALVHKNKTETRPRRVHLYEIELISEDGGMTHIENAAYPIRARHVIVAKPGTMRHTVLPFKCLYLHLMVEDSSLSSLLDAIPDVFIPTDPEEIEAAFYRLITAYTSPDVDGGMHLAGMLCTFLSTLIRDARLTANSGRESGGGGAVIERALNYIHAHECQNITLQDIADHVHLSRFYFHHLFLTATGRTPHRYLLERRIARARQLLITTEKPLSEIASDCGFSSQSYFNQVFQKEMGCTPGTYKKEMSLRY